MPCQVGSQFVAIKPQPRAQGLGPLAMVTSETRFGTASAGDAPTSDEAAAAARMVIAKMRSFVMRAPFLNIEGSGLVNVSRQATCGSIRSDGTKVSLSGNRATVIRSAP